MKIECTPKQLEFEGIGRRKLGAAFDADHIEMIAADLELVRAASREEREGAPTPAYRELRYQTRDSWTRERRVVAKAQWLGDKSNPRFVVTPFCEQTQPAAPLRSPGHRDAEGAGRHPPPSGCACLLKVAAIVRVSVRRVALSLSAAAPVRDLFARIAEQLRTVPAPS